jgi:Mrp family chromosome partitioning ATPase
MITLTQDPARAPVARNAVEGPIAEQYQALVRWLRSAECEAPRSPRAIGVTSCVRGSGVSTVARNLAWAAAQIEEAPVLLLDLSRAGSAGPSRSDCSEPHGFSEFVERWEQRVAPSKTDNLSLLTMGHAEDTDTIAVGRDGINDLIRSFENEFGFIVVDLPTADSHLCLATAGLLHGILLVMDSEHTCSDIATLTSERLAHAHGNILGAILNKHSEHLPRWLENRL